MPEGRLAFRLAEGRGFSVTDLEGRRLRTLTARGRKAVGKPVFNERGTRLWFLSEGSGRLWLETRPVTHRGSSSSPLPFRRTPDTAFAVSPTGKRVAVNDVAFGRRSPCGDAALVSSSGRLIRRFRGGRAVHFRLAPWSPDGTRLAYVRGGCFTKCPEETLLVAGPGPQEIRVADRPCSQFVGITWDPAGRRIAFADCPDDCPVSVVRVGRRASRVIARYAWSLVTWTTRTDEIVYKSEYPEPRFMAVRADGSKTRELRDVQGIETSSPDGNRVLIRGSEGRAVMDVATGRQWLLPPAVQRRLSVRPGAVAYLVR
jgi:hypothetical protein